MTTFSKLATTLGGKQLPTHFTNPSNDVTTIGPWRRASTMLLVPKRIPAVSHKPLFSILPFAVLCGLLLEVALRVQSSYDLLELPSLPYPLEDPYSLPGHLAFDPSDPLATEWKPFSNHTTPSWHTLLRTAGNLGFPDVHWNGMQANPDTFVKHSKHPTFPLDGYGTEDAAKIQEDALAKIDHLRNANILVLGDSVDRNGIEQLGILYQKPVKVDTYNGTSSPAHTGLPRVFHIGGKVNLTISNGFFYGAADDIDDFSFAWDWTAPGRAEERIEQLFKVRMDRIERTPTLISLHSGMWDLAFFGRQDKIAKADTNTPLSDERLAHWQARTTSVIRKVKSTWPGVPIVFRKLHRVGNTKAADDWQPNHAETAVNYFTDIRFHQIRSMQDAVAEREGIAVFDFGALFEGFQNWQDKVHPVLFPGGIIMANGLFHHAYLAKHQPGYNRLAVKVDNPTAASVAAKYMRMSRAGKLLLDAAGTARKS